MRWKDPVAPSSSVAPGPTMCYLFSHSSKDVCVRWKFAIQRTHTDGELSNSHEVVTGEVPTGSDCPDMAFFSGTNDLLVHAPTRCNFNAVVE